MDIFRQSSPTRENLGLLAVMEVLEDQEQITQRELARETGLNLKKVNYTLQKLLEKGHVKFQRVRQNPNKRAYLYILTPAGLKAKSQLTYRFLKFTIDFYGKMEEKLLGCLHSMTQAGVKRVVLYGASDVARILLGLVNGAEMDVMGVVDDAYEGREFHGIPVFKSHQLNDLCWDKVLITVLEDLGGAEERLKKLGVVQEVIWKLS